MKSFADLERETAAVQLAFLLADLATANTFLDVAETTSDNVTRERNIGNANTAHEAVTRFFPRVTMTALQTTDVQDRLGLLRGRITAMEQTQAR